MTTRGPLVDFGGVLSTDQFAALHSFCSREGLPHNAFEPLAPLVVELELGALSQTACKPNPDIYGDSVEITASMSVHKGTIR